MAEEVKKIITVEVGKSITSVRDFKKHIEDLRGALLGLNEESEEYKTIAEQIATDQAKLNEVMQVGKGNTDSAAGSYNELNNQLKALRQQYKALSETERNGATGQAILQNITKLDTELKDIDESMGQYYRNVGNYKGAFEEAFKAMAQNIGNVNPELGKLMRTAAQLIPLIKAATKAATTGLKGIKAGLASTGIGLLVVALGEIVAHWEEISNWVSKVIGKQKDLTSEVKNTSDAAKDLATNIKAVYDAYDNELRARGITGRGALEQRLTRQVADELSNNQRIKELEDLHNDIAIIMHNYNMSRGATEQWDEFYNLQNALDEVEKGLIHEVDEFGHEINRLDRVRGKLVDIRDIKGVGEKLLREIDSDIEHYRKANDEIVKLQTQTESAIHDYDANQYQQGQERVKKAQEINKSESELRKERYQDEYFGFLESIENQKQYARETIQDSQQLNDRLIELEQEKNTGLKAIEEEFQYDMKEIRKKEWQSSDKYKRLQEAKDLYNELLNYGKDEVELVQEKYEEELALLEQFGYDTTNLTNKYLDDIQEAIKNKSDDIDSLIEQIAEEIRQTWEKAFQVDLQKIEDAETAALHGADMMWTINPKTHESDINLEREKEDKIYEIRKKGYEDRIDLYEKQLLLLEAGSEEYLDMERQITQAKMDLDDLGYQHAVDLEERKRQDIQLTIDKVNEAVRIAQGSIQFYGGIANEIAAYTLETAKEGTAEYKAAQITQTIVSTLSGMVGSFSQAMSLYGPTPWGFALGAAGATAMGIIGALRVNQIKNANGNSSIGSSSAGASAPGVGVEPLLNPDYDLQRITNLSLQSDEFLPGKTQVYVLESDIQEVGNRVQVREQNATF